MLALAIGGSTVAKSRTVASQVRAIGPMHIASGPTTLAADFALSIWIPTRALLKGRDPYDPRNTAVEKEYGARLPAALYVPAMLLILWPLAAMSLPDAAAGMVIVSCLLLWASLCLLIRPKGSGGRLLLAGLGIVTVYGYAAENTLLLGQPTAVVMLGFALLARSMITGKWGIGAIVGSSLLLMKPQYGLPVLALLAILRQWRTTGWSALVVLLLSLPFGILEIDAAGGVGAAVDSWRRNLTFFEHHDSGWGRTDTLTLLTWGNPARAGTAGAAAVFAVLALAIALAARARSGTGTVAFVAAACGFVLASAYHTSYDLLIVAVPVALALSRPRWWRDALAWFLLLFVFLNFISRASIRYRIGGLFEKLMLDAWPPVTALGLLIIGLCVALYVGRPRSASSSATR